ncbi:MAG: phospho-N-acetylmuramoyl-pentapeptide-transferase [Firmicutes bacterium]|nr:phospho-N-acetylmuramoyl-pentapeptide-transferase [Bacillota bacterium]
MLLRYGLGFITAFIATVIAMPLVIHLSKKLKLRQTILHYVDNHQQKTGTPTMGGIAFIFSAALSAFAFMTNGFSLMLLVVTTMLAFGILGFFDDFIKVFFKQNKGLSGKQKIIFQFLIASAVSVYAYFLVGDNLYVPFTFQEISLGWFVIPLSILVFLALTNSVNLIDGLDGLCAKVSIAYATAFAVLVAIIVHATGISEGLTYQYQNVIIFSAALIGALFGFICYNGYPAKIFMGDTGALAIGGALATLAIVTRMTLIIPIIGIMLVLTSLSDIIQVLYFKRTKGKRVFLMAPLHHHYERKGVHENRIVTVYTSITMLMGAGTILLTLLFV